MPFRILDHVTFSPGVRQLARTHNINLAKLLVYHATGDAEEMAGETTSLLLRINTESRVHSVYAHHNPEWTIWIVTAKQSPTTLVVLPDERKIYLKSLTDAVDAADHTTRQKNYFEPYHSPR